MALFAAAWRPTALAHNDFYDDQMLLMPAGNLALVDFEETGPGDPMLAHLRWMAGFAPKVPLVPKVRILFLKSILV